jgi:uncharacterized protein (DUF1499 family)
VRWILICVIVVTLGFMAYVRLMPGDPAKVHVDGVARAPGDYPTAGSFTAVRTLQTTPDDALAALDQIAAATPRTKILAGTVAEGLITYETRSRIVGFPDYTTVSIIPAHAAPGGNANPLIMIHARLRYGSADLGVNRKRVVAWLAQLGDKVAAP